MGFHSTIPRCDPFFPLTATPGWTGWYTKSKGAWEYNLFLVRLPEFSSGIAMILDDKDNDHKDILLVQDIQDKDNDHLVEYTAESLYSGHTRSL